MHEEKRTGRAARFAEAERQCIAWSHQAMTEEIRTRIPRKTGPADRKAKAIEVAATLGLDETETHWLVSWWESLGFVPLAEQARRAKQAGWTRSEMEVRLLIHFGRKRLPSEGRKLLRLWD